jgi:lipopolysaccharide export system permease protein
MILGMGKPKNVNSDIEIVKETAKTETEKEDRVSNRVKFLTSKIAGDCSRIEQYDQRIRKFQAEIHKKYAIPCACLAFVLIGCPLGIMSRRGNFGFAAGISLAFYVLYWGCLITGEDFADKGILDPGLSMWFGDIVIGVFGILLTLRVNYESLSFLIPDFLRKAKKKGNYAV